MELKCAVQQYPWGKIGCESEVANLASGNDSDLVINDSNPYAELWMGTHINGPSTIKSSGQLLGDWIGQHPESLGAKSQEKFGNTLPFLFKVLSVNKALSVQAHPSKAHAEQLHKDHPDIYKDANHKPELAIALTPFEALCGFRPIAEIIRFFNCIPELCTVVGNSTVAGLCKSDKAGLDAALKECFLSMLRCPQQTIEVQLNSLLKRLQGDAAAAKDLLLPLLERLHSEFPGDIGCFSIYLFNVVKLLPGQAIFLGPNEPHAYLSGDCIECMACSDNVVRAGLTPKYKDVETLVGMLTYICEPAESKLFASKREDDYCVTFNPPVPDFAVALITVPVGVAKYKLLPRKSASIILVVKGNATADNLSLKRGSALFLLANQTMTLDIAGKDGLIVTQAMSNV